MVVRLPTSAVYSPNGPLFNLTTGTSFLQQHCGSGHEMEQMSRCSYLMTMSKRLIRVPSSRPLRMPPLPTTTQRWHLCDLFLNGCAESECGSYKRKATGNKQAFCLEALQSDCLVSSYCCYIIHCDTVSLHQEVQFQSVHISQWKHFHNNWGKSKIMTIQDLKKYLQISAIPPLCFEDLEIQMVVDTGRDHQRVGHLSKGRVVSCNWKEVAEVTNSLWFCWDDTGPPELYAHDHVPARNRVETSSKLKQCKETVYQTFGLSQRQICGRPDTSFFITPYH